MKKVIRLTESDLTKIVKQVIKENQQQMLQQKAQSCFDPKKYPQIAGLMQAYGCSIFTMLAALATVFSGGTAAGISFTAALMGAGGVADGVEKAINNPKSTFKNEATTFLKCVGIM